MVASSKYGYIYLLSQNGTLFLHDIHTGRQVFGRKVSNVCKSIHEYHVINLAIFALCIDISYELYIDQHNFSSASLQNKWYNYM